MLCRNCGAENPDNGKFCTLCGAKIGEEPVCVNQQRTISDRHYSLEEISRQQEEAEISGIKSAEISGVNLKKSGESGYFNYENTDEYSGNGQSSSIDVQTVGGAAGEVYKMKSGGFDDEKEPVKRPPITGAPEPQIKNTAPVQMGGFSFESQSNNTNNYANQYSQNRDYSFGRMPQSNANNAANQYPQSGGYSFSGAPQNNVNNPTNQYSPIATPVKSGGDGKAAKILLFSAITVAILLIGGIVYMLISGYYNGEETPYSNTQLVSDAGDVSAENLIFSNQANYGLATEDHSGNVYYSDSNGYIQKVDKNGIKTQIYDRQSISLNYYDGKLYFLSKVNGYLSVCSVFTDGTGFKAYTSQRDVSYLSVIDGYVYYAINKYDSSKSATAVFRVDIESGEVKNIFLADDSSTLSVFADDRNIYIHSMEIESYIGSITKIDKITLKDSGKLNTDYDYYLCVMANGMFYFVNYDEYTEEYSIYSMNKDGSNGKKICGTDCEEIAVYGNYIYYTDTENRALYRIKNDGTGNVKIKDKSVSYINFAGGQIYYMDYLTDKTVRMNLDGSGSKII